MKKQGVTFFVLRALARHLQYQADMLFRLVGEEERLQTKQEDRATRHLNSAEAEIPPAHWLAKNDAAGPPAHWLKRVQQTAPTMRARAHQSHTLPIEPAPTNRQGSGNGSDALIPLETAAPSSDAWTMLMETTVPFSDAGDMPTAWPTEEADAISLTENEIQRPISSSSQLEDATKDVRVPTRARHAINVTYPASASTPGNALSLSKEPSPRRISPVAPGQSSSPRAVLANREQVSLSTSAPGSTVQEKAREVAVAQPRQERDHAPAPRQQDTVPHPCQEQDCAPAPRQEEGWTSHAHDTTKEAVLFTRPVERDASQPPLHWSGHAPQTASTGLLTGENQARSTVDPRLSPPPVARVNNDRWHTINTKFHKNSSEQISTPERHMVQEKWPDLPTEQKLSREAGAPGAHFSGSVDHTRWPALNLPTPAQQPQASGRAGEQSQVETGWPALPREKFTDEWDWDRTRQVWEHRQRLNAEQRGYLWNA